MPYGRLLFFLVFGLSSLLAPSLIAASATVLITPLHNESQLADLSWIGESVAETLMSELGAEGQIVLDRDVREEGYRRLGLKPDTLYTKATILKLGQTLDADYVCYGSFEITTSPGSQPRDGTIRMSLRFLDLRKLRDASEFSESGKLLDISRLEEHLAWQALRFLDPQSTLTQDRLMQRSKLIRLEAKESYIRGLVATSQDQKQKWLEQALKLDDRYSQAAFEIGKLSLTRKDYRQAAIWFARVPQSDTLYLDARFRMGLSSYWAGDYLTAEHCFRDLSASAPLNEVFNNLGAAESRLNRSTAASDFTHALEGDQTDPTYNFNCGLMLYRESKFDEAGKHFRSVTARDPEDGEARDLLTRCEQRNPPSANAPLHAKPAERLKKNFDLTAFRQLKAVLQNSK